MPCTLEKLPDAPIVVFTQGPDSDEAAEIRSVVADVMALLDQQTSQVFLILDVRNSQASLDELIRAATLLARSENSMLHHRNIRRNVYVSARALMTMAVKGLASATFGSVRIAMFATLDEALDYCRGQLAQS